MPKKKKVKPTKERLSGDITIAHALEKFPQIGPILAQYGVHCIGCHISGYESLEEGLMAHGFTEEDIDSILKEMNEALEFVPEQVAKPPGKPVELSRIAAEKIRELLKAQGKEGYCLRIRVLPGESNYWMGFEREKAESDILRELEGIKLILDPESDSQLDNYTIEYIETPEEKGFKFIKG